MITTNAQAVAKIMANAEGKPIVLVVAELVAAQAAALDRIEDALVHHLPIRWNENEERWVDV